MQDIKQYISFSFRNLSEFRSKYKRIKKLRHKLSILWRKHEVSDMTKYLIRNCTFSYIPILDTIKSLFENSSFRGIYFGKNDKTVKSKSVISDFCDGDIFCFMIYLSNYIKAKKKVLLKFT